MYLFIYFFLGNQASPTKIFNNFTQNSHGVYETPLKLYGYITLQNLSKSQLDTSPYKNEF